MKIDKIKNRHVIFKFNIADWDLNIHLIMGNKNNYIIDSGLGSLSIKPVIDYIREDMKPIILINTHYHWDHIWGNHILENGTIISHKLCRDMIQNKWDDMFERKMEYIKGDTKKCLPNLVFEDMLYFPEDSIRIFHTPGHTIDSISVYDEVEKVINVSDNIGDNMEEIIPSLENDTDIYRKTIQEYKNMDIEYVVSGHNVVLKKDIFYKIICELDNSN